jgi:hypothetical protein
MNVDKNREAEERNRKHDDHGEETGNLDGKGNYFK